jgi:hypothetical protein
MFGCKKKEYKEICAALNLTSGGIYKRVGHLPRAKARSL